MTALWLAAILAASTTGGGAPATPARFAVVVGYNGGEPDPHAPLRFADDDAARFYLQLLPSLELGVLLTTFDRQSARMFGDLTGIARAPTLAELSRAIGEVFWQVRTLRARGTSTELIFYFAGHGDVSDTGEGFVVLADGPFSRSDLEAQIVRASPADLNHVVIDACASYYMTRSRGDGEAQSGAVALTPELLNVLRSGRREGDALAWARTGVMVSTSNAAAVHESDELGAGVFSYLLRSALSGGADMSGDGRVEYAEAAAFIAAAGSGIADTRARLSVVAEPPLQRPHVALSDVRRSGAEHFLALDGQRQVHLRILDDRGTPVAELHRAQGPPALIALTGSRYFVVQQGSQEALLVPRAAGAYALRSLDFHEGPARRAAEAGPLSALMAQPYSHEFLQGFVSQSQLPAPSVAEHLVIRYAPPGEPPFALPFDVIGVGLAAGALVSTTLAVVGTFASLATYAQLSERFDRSGQLDPELALQVEILRTGTGAALAAALLMGLGSGASLWLAIDEEAP